MYEVKNTDLRDKKWIFRSFTSENPKSQKAIFLQKSTGSFFLSNTVDSEPSRTSNLSSIEKYIVGAHLHI